MTRNATEEWIKHRQPCLTQGGPITFSIKHVIVQWVDLVHQNSNKSLYPTIETIVYLVSEHGELHKY